jgi:hypothetical protein
MIAFLFGLGCNNIPKPHNFVGLPLQSKIFDWTNVRKHFTLSKVLTGITNFLFLEKFNLG